MRVATIGTVPGNAGASTMKSKITIMTKIRNIAQFLYTLLRNRLVNSCKEVCFKI